MRVRSSVWLLVVALVMGEGAWGVSAPAGALKRVPRLFVVPSVGLHNKQVVKVRGINFTPKDTVFVTECLIRATGQNGCDIMIAKPVTISSTGTFGWTKFKVLTGKVGSGTCGTTKVNLRACAVSAGNPSGGDSAVAPIVFALPKKK